VSIPKIEPGDVVRIVAPAGKGNAANLPLIRGYVNSLELVPILRDDVYADVPFYSNTDEFRAEDFLAAMMDNDCKVIWTIRGGAGCIRIIKFLEEQLPPTPPPTPKILIGYSDITALHLYFQYKYNWPSMHGAMLDAIASGAYPPNSETVTALRSLLFNLTTQICEPVLSRIDRNINTPTIEAVVTGGNLTLVETSIGTNWTVNASGKILFLEDVGEAAYSIERSLDHMKQSGVFDGVLAVVFGDFTNPDDVNLMNLVFQRFADDETITMPVFKLTGIGHGSANIPLPMNCPGTITVENPNLQTYRLCVNNIAFQP